MNAKRGNVLLYTVAVLILTIACVLSGCGSGGSDGSGGQKVYVIGDIIAPARDATEEIAEVRGPADAVKRVFVFRVPYDGVSADAPIFIAADQVLFLSETVQRGLLDTYRSGHPIIVVRAGEAEINALLGMLGMDRNYKLPENIAFAELFAVDAEQGGRFMWSMFPPGASTADGVTDPYTDDANARIRRVEMLSQWMEQNNSRMSALTSFKKEAEKSIAAKDAGETTEKNLRELAQVYQQAKWFVDPISGNNYQLIYNIYSCHSFSTSDGKYYDWFYVEQNGTLNGSKGYQGIKSISFFELPSWDTDAEGMWWWMLYDAAKYYVGSYSMFNSIMAIGEDKEDRSVVLERSSPEGKNRETTTHSGISYNISGTLGFKAGTMGGGSADGNASVTGGLNVSHDDTIITTDCTTDNTSISSGYMDQASWLYTFKKMTQYGWLAVSCKLNDPVSLSIMTFFPYNKWIWKFSPDVRDGKKKYKDRFLTQLTVENMVSVSTWAIGWQPVGEPRHHAKTSSFTDYITLSYPPLIVAPGTNVTFSAQGQVKYMDALVSSDWTASSDQPWCQAVPTTGKGNNSQVSITVSANNTGRERKATVTFATRDGKEKDTMIVTQSQY